MTLKKKIKRLNWFVKIAFSILGEKMNCVSYMIHREIKDISRVKWKNEICGALRNLVLFVQFKKRLKPATLLKLTLLRGCFLRFLNCTNVTESCNVPHIRERSIFLKKIRILLLLYSIEIVNLWKTVSIIPVTDIYFYSKAAIFD